MDKYLTHAIGPKFLFRNFDHSATHITNMLGRKYHAADKCEFVAKIFARAIYLIFLDIIDNNCTFVFPLSAGRHACFYVRPVRGEELKLARQRGAFAGIDLLSTNFTGYQMVYSWETKNGTLMKPIYLNKRYKDIFYKNINEGKQYF